MGWKGSRPRSNSLGSIDCEHVVLGEDRVERDDRQSLKLSLRHKGSIERISVKRREIPDCKSVLDSDGQRPEALFKQQGNDFFNRLCQLKPI